MDPLSIHTKLVAHWNKQWDPREKLVASFEHDIRAMRELNHPASLPHETSALIHGAIDCVNSGEMDTAIYLVNALVKSHLDMREETYDWWLAGHDALVRMLYNIKLALKNRAAPVLTVPILGENMNADAADVDNDSDDEDEDDEPTKISLSLDDSESEDESLSAKEASPISKNSGRDLSVYNFRDIYEFFRDKGAEVLTDGCLNVTHEPYTEGQEHPRGIHLAFEAYTWFYGRPPRSPFYADAGVIKESVTAYVEAGEPFDV